MDLGQQIDTYHRRFAHDLASVHVNQIYRIRENRRACASRGIRLSGRPLGRPRIVSEATAEQVKHDQQQVPDDATALMAVEGKFGQGKRRFGIGRLMAKLALTSETMIHSSFLVKNLERLLTLGIVYWLCSWWQGWRSLGNGLVGVWWLQMQTTFRDDRVYDGEVRGARSAQFLGGV